MKNETAADFLAKLVMVERALEALTSSAAFKKHTCLCEALACEYATAVARSVAFQFGQKAARGGTAHKPCQFSQEQPAAAWQLGVELECEAMREEAAKIPLVFEDEKP